MTGEEFSKLWAMLHAAWPLDFPNDTQDTKTLWASRLMHHDYRAARGAVNEWIDSHRKAPKIADVMEGIRKQTRQRPASGLEQVWCGKCDHGWEWIGLDGHGLVERCREGCSPIPLQQRETNGSPMAPSVAAALRETLAGLTPPKAMGARR